MRNPLGQLQPPLGFRRIVGQLVWRSNRIQRGQAGRHHVGAAALRIAAQEHLELVGDRFELTHPPRRQRRHGVICRFTSASCRFKSASCCRCVRRDDGIDQSLAAVRGVDGLPIVRMGDLVHCWPSSETSIRYSLTNAATEWSPASPVRSLENKTRSIRSGRASVIVNSGPDASQRAPNLPSIARPRAVGVCEVVGHAALPWPLGRRPMPRPRCGTRRPRSRPRTRRSRSRLVRMGLFSAPSTTSRTNPACTGANFSSVPVRWIGGPRPGRLQLRRLLLARVSRWPLPTRRAASSTVRGFRSRAATRRREPAAVRPSPPRGCRDRRRQTWRTARSSPAAGWDRTCGRGSGRSRRSAPGRLRPWRG